MLRRQNSAKSPFQRRIEAAFPWMVLVIILIGVLINAIITIQHRTEDRLAEKQACRDGVASAEIDCSIYFGPRWTDRETIEPVAENKNNLSEAP